MDTYLSTSKVVSLMNKKDFDYPYFGQHPWYAILLQDKFLSCFSDESYYASVSGEKYETLKTIWTEFSEIIQGMTLGCSFCDSCKKEQVAEDCIRMSSITGMAFCHYLHTCPPDPTYFSKLWHSTKDMQPIIYEKLQAEQLAILIFYPFWHRLGINDEEEFIRSGRLGYYLQILYKRLY